MSIWDEPLTKGEYLRRLYEARPAAQKGTRLPFEEKSPSCSRFMKDASRALRDAPVARRLFTRTGPETRVACPLRDDARPPRQINSSRAPSAS